MHDVRREVTAVWIAALVLGAVAAGLALFLTAPRGLATTTDAAFYCQAATTLARGQGVMVYGKDAALQPLTHYPLLYPAALSAGLFLGVSVMDWARYLQAGLFGLNIMLVCGIIFYLTRRARDAAIAGVLGIGWVHFLQLHLMLVSEPLFILLLLGGLWALALYAQSPCRRWLVMAAACAGACALTRYVGFSLVLAGGVIVWMMSSHSLAGKIKAAAVFGVLSLALPAAWLWRNMQVTGNPVDGAPGLAWLPWPVWMRGVDSLSQFLLPLSVPMAVRIAALACVLLGLAVVLVRARGQRTAASSVVAVFTSCYLCFLIASMLLLPGGIGLNVRIFVPVILAALVFGAPGLWPAAGRLARVLCMIFVAAMFVRTAQFGADMRAQGYGYSSRSWADTALVKALKALPENVPVYANDTQAVYIYTGRPAVRIPHARMSTGYWPPEENVRQDFTQRRAVAVIFDEQRFEPHLEWQRLAAGLSLSAALRDGRGAIYVFDSPGRDHER